MKKPAYQRGIENRGKKINYPSGDPRNGQNEQVQSEYDAAMIELEKNEYIGDKFNTIYDQLMKRCKANLIKTYGD